MNIILKVSPVLGITIALGVYWYMANNSTAPHVPLVPKPQAPAESRAIQPAAPQAVVPATLPKNAAMSLADSRSWADVLSHDLSAARHGDGDSAYRIYEIALDCLGNPSEPKLHMQVLAETINHPKVRQALRDEMALELRKCANVDTMLAGQADPDDWLKLAAAEGQPEAEIDVLTDCPNLQISLADCLGTLHRFLDDKTQLTPDRLGILLYRFGDDPLPNDGSSSSYAGLLANCDSGAVDCSQDSAAMRMFCKEDVCPRLASVREGIRQRLDEAGYQAVSDFAAHLIALTHSDNIYAAPEISDIEAQIRQHDQEMQAA